MLLSKNDLNMSSFYFIVLYIVKHRNLPEIKACVKKRTGKRKTERHRTIPMPLRFNAYFFTVTLIFANVPVCE